MLNPGNARSEAQSQGHTEGGGIRPWPRLLSTMFALNKGWSKTCSHRLAPSFNHKNITFWNFSFIFSQDVFPIKISCFDPSRFNEILILATPEKVNIKFVSEAVKEIDSVALKQELIG